MGESLIEIKTKILCLIKSIPFLGMEMKPTFIYNILAVNPEATTRKSRNNLAIKDFVVNQITMGIRQQIEMEAQNRKHKGS